MPPFSLVSPLFPPTHPPTHTRPTAPHSNRLVFLYLLNPPTHPPTHPQAISRLSMGLQASSNGPYPCPAWVLPPLYSPQEKNWSILARTPSRRRTESSSGPSQPTARKVTHPPTHPPTHAIQTTDGKLLWSLPANGPQGIKSLLPPTHPPVFSSTLIYLPLALWISVQQLIQTASFSPTHPPTSSERYW